MRLVQHRMLAHHVLAAAVSYFSLEYQVRHTYAAHLCFYGSSLMLRLCQTSIFTIMEVSHDSCRIMSRSRLTDKSQSHPHHTSLLSRSLGSEQYISSSH